MKLKFDKFDFFNLLIIPIYLIIIIFSSIIFLFLYLFSLPSQCILYFIEDDMSKKNEIDTQKNISYNKIEDDEFTGNS
jgi:flagellar basal body-associated protein FliL